MKRKIINRVLKETVTFIKTAAETNGKLSELEITLMPGGGNPLHYHTSYIEIFTALEGQLVLELANKRKVILQPGESFVVNIGDVHRFFNPGVSQIRFKNEVHPDTKGLKIL